MKLWAEVEYLLLFGVLRQAHIDVVTFTSNVIFFDWHLSLMIFSIFSMFLNIIICIIKYHHNQIYIVRVLHNMSLTTACANRTWYTQQNPAVVIRFLSCRLG